MIILCSGIIKDTEDWSEEEFHSIYVVHLLILFTNRPKLHKEELKAVLKEKGRDWLKICDVDSDGYIDIAHFASSLYLYLKARRLVQKYK